MTINSVLALFSPILLKVFLIAITFLNSFALYFMTTYKVILDRSMMGNVLNTRYSESIELLTPGLALYILLTGVLPVLALIKIKIVKVDRLKIAVNAIIIVFLSCIFLYANAASWLWIDKHASVIGGKILPWSYIINTSRHYATLNKSTTDQLKLPDGKLRSSDKTVFVLVIGETARSANFSLYDYPRNTNPKLQKQPNLIVFNSTQSCTTYTTASLACILAASESHLDYEMLPTYLFRHGVEVIWRSNNWGEPPIDVTSYVQAKDLRENCMGEGCELDEVLLTDLIPTIQNSNSDKILVVLHTKGSHGPSYYARYTKDFNYFKPVCEDEEIANCKSNELVNAYDNTILYTDHFLNSLIEKLERLKNTQTAMMYISDHGESLGEHGLYLHGTPISIAPDYQKNIPFIVWLSDEYLYRNHINLQNIKQANQHSHFNVFHTIVNGLGLQTSAYRSDFDVLAE